MGQQQPPEGYGVPGYGAPQGYPPQPPPKKGLSGWMVALMVIGGMTVLGMGSCVLCVGLGVAGSAAKHASEMEHRVANAEAHPGAAAAPAVVVPVDIKALLAEYKDNEVRADSEFKGKTVRVSGKVNAIKKDILDHMFVTVGTGRDFEIPEVQCTLNGENQSVASNLSKGQTVTVQGDVRGLMMNVQLENCDIVQ